MRLTLVAIFICACISSFSTDTVTYKNNTSIAFSTLNFHDGPVQLNNILSLEFGYDRNFSDILSFGGYLGIGIFDEWYKEDSDGLSYTFTKMRYSTRYGLKSKLHILPIQFGLIPERGTYIDGSLMGGGLFYFSKKTGAFFEAGYSWCKYHKGFSARYGLAIRF